MKGIALDRNNHYSPLPQVLSDDDDETNDLVSRTSTKLLENHELSVAMVSPTSSRSVKGMSSARWLCFSVSVVLALVAVVVFLWILPCELTSSPCRSSLSRDRSTDWRMSFPASVFTSGLQLVDADQDGVMDIMLGFRPVQGNSTIPPDWFVSGSATGGIMVLCGRDGHKIWSQTYHDAPKDVMCNAVDVDADGVNDCILVGDHLFSAINISNDHTFWYVHSHPNSSRSSTQRPKVSSATPTIVGSSSDNLLTTSQPYTLHPKALSVPAILTDLTDDDVPELVVTCQIDTEAAAYAGPAAAFLWLISGSMGSLLGQPVALPACVSATQPVTIADNGTLNVAVVCETDGDQSVVLTLSLDSLWESSKGSANGPAFLVAYRFPFQEKQLRVWVSDINGDGISDVVVSGDKGTVTALHGTTWDVLWTENVGDYKIGSCMLGPATDDGSHLVLLTLFPHDCRQGCNSIAVALSGKNGTRMWTYNSIAMLSPVLVTTPTKWPSMLAFKEVMQLSLEEETASLVGSTLQNAGPTKNDEQTSESVVMAMQVRQALLLLIGGVQSEAIALETNVTMCYIAGDQLLCLPTSATQISGAIGDMDGDEYPDFISVMTEAQQGENSTPHVIVTKTSLGRRPETVEDEDQMYANDHGPTTV